MRWALGGAGKGEVRGAFISMARGDCTWEQGLGEARAGVVRGVPGVQSVRRCSL